MRERPNLHSNLRVDNVRQNRSSNGLTSFIFTNIPDDVGKKEVKEGACGRK